MRALLRKLLTHTVKVQFPARAWRVVNSPDSPDVVLLAFRGETEASHVTIPLTREHARRIGRALVEKAGPE